ncbi:MAG: PHP-associated domain-containing protein [archaeon]
MLKADLHLHSNDDKRHRALSYDSKDLIDEASKQGFDVLALTFHGDVFYTKKIVNYAKKKGILLISGIEKYIEEKEVLIYNLTQEESKKLNTFDDLRKLKSKKNILVIAPHPFFKTKSCLGNKLVKNIDVFDAIEYSHFYLPYFNLNRKAVRLAKKKNLSLVGTSDTHYISQLGNTYSYIDSEKNIEAIFQAIKKGKVKMKSKPVTLKQFIERFFKIILHRE